MATLTPKPLSRQRLAQIQAHKDGLCESCFKPNPWGGTFCPRCTANRAKAKRKKLGCKPWHEGGRGRPPKFREANQSIQPT